MAQQAEDAPPPWWDDDMVELIQRRAPMPNPDRWQSSYVRYKCQPEAALNAPWRLQEARRHADQLALDQGLSVAPNEEALYDGRAPRSVALRVVTAPAEWCVPVKQDRRLTPGFVVRAEVAYRGSCRFPLTLKAYVLAQPRQASPGDEAAAAAAAGAGAGNDSDLWLQRGALSRWVPDDFLEAPPAGQARKPITELKGVVCVTHVFEASAPEPGPEHQAARAEAEAVARDAQARLRACVAAVDPAMGALLQHAQGPCGELDASTLERLLGPAAGTGGGPAAAATPPTTAAQLGRMLAAALPPCHAAQADAVASAAAAAAAAAEAAADAAAGPLATLTHDYEFANLEFLKPTRMGRAILAFAGGVLGQDLVFACWEVPTVGICRAEQRAKACARLGLVYGEPTGPPTALEHVYALPRGPEERARLAALVAGAALGSGAGGGGSARAGSPGSSLFAVAPPVVANGHGAGNHPGGDDGPNNGGGGGAPEQPPRGRKRAGPEEERACGDHDDDEDDEEEDGEGARCL